MTEYLSMLSLLSKYALNFIQLIQPSTIRFRIISKRLLLSEALFTSTSYILYSITHIYMCHVYYIFFNVTRLYVYR